VHDDDVHGRHHDDDDNVTYACSEGSGSLQQVPSMSFIVFLGRLINDSFTDKGDALVVAGRGSCDWISLDRSRFVLPRRRLSGQCD